jgi:redox-sensitive bicupin YhaK (pirin superfamily)
LISAYDVDLPAGDTCRLPASNGGRLVIAIAGNSTTLSAGVNQLLRPDGFVFVSPHKKMEIVAGSQTAARCILLEIQ